MWKYLAYDANWTEIVTNALALGFSLMAIVVIGYAVIFDPEILAAVGSVTSGITGVILGFYFNRERLKSAQNQASAATVEQKAASEQASEAEQRLERLMENYASTVLEFEQFKRDMNHGDEDEPYDSEARGGNAAS